MCLRLFTCRAICTKRKKKSFYFYCPSGDCAPWPIEQHLCYSGLCAIKLLTNSPLYTCINEEILLILLHWRKTLTIASVLVKITWPDVPVSGRVLRVTDCACEVEFKIRIVKASWGGWSFLLGYTVFSTAWTRRNVYIYFADMGWRSGCTGVIRIQYTRRQLPTLFLLYRFWSVQSSLNSGWRIQQQ